MNWARGLFRLWLVLSLAWVAVAFLIMRPDQAATRYFEAREEIAGLKQRGPVEETAEAAPAFSDSAEHAERSSERGASAAGLRRVTDPDLLRLLNETGPDPRSDEGDDGQGSSEHGSQWTPEQQAAIDRARHRQAINVSERLEVRAMNDLLSGLVVIFAPSIALLILGLLGFWVARGFKGASR